MTEITITDGHMSHTVKTKEEAQRIIDRYFSVDKEEKHG